MALMHNRTIGCLYVQKYFAWYRNRLLKMSGKGAWTVFVRPWSAAQQCPAPDCSWIKLLAVSHFCMSLYSTLQICMPWFTGLTFSHTCDSKVNFDEPAFYFTVTLCLTATQVKISRFQITMTMSDLQSLNTSLLEVMISSNNECVFIRDLSVLPLQILFDAWCASMNDSSKGPIAWNSSKHEASWRFYLHCEIEDTGSPGIICIVYHQVLHNPSEHGTSSMGKHLLAKAHIAKLNKLQSWKLPNWLVQRSMKQH